jgi:integron integrase
MITTEAPQKAERRVTREQFKQWLVTRHFSPRTVERYVGWAIKLAAFTRRNPAEISGEQVREFLTHLANRVHVTATTQKQALCALVRLAEFVGTELGDIGRFAPASKQSRLPEVMSVGEVFKVLAVLPLPYRLMAQLMYGCGLRLMECCRLRVKDVDFERGTLMVRAGKGDKDRLVMLPQSVVQPLKDHLAMWRVRFDSDGGWLVHLPGALDKKYPGYAREWRWQYVFPAKSLSTDPTDGRIKRHHVHENALQKAVKEAVATAGITRRVTCHTFRHSFATHLLESGVGIEDVKTLLGHERIETTMVYIHVARPAEKRIKSPLDAGSAPAGLTIRGRVRAVEGKVGDRGWEMGDGDGRWGWEMGDGRWEMGNRKARP